MTETMAEQMNEYSLISAVDIVRLNIGKNVGSVNLSALLTWMAPEIVSHCDPQARTMLRIEQGRERPLRGQFSGQLHPKQIPFWIDFCSEAKLHFGSGSVVSCFRSKIHL